MAKELPIPTLRPPLWQRALWTVIEWGVLLGLLVGVGAWALNSLPGLRKILFWAFDYLASGVGA